MSEEWGWVGLVIGAVLFWLASDLGDYGYENASKGHQIAALVSFLAGVLVLGQSLCTLMPG